MLIRYGGILSIVYNTLGIKRHAYALVSGEKKDVFILLVIIGAVKILLTRLRQERGSRIITAISVIVGITAVLLLAMGREAYGVSMLFLMTVAKGIVIYKMR